MKNIWIFYSVDGPIYYSNPRKAYLSAKQFINKLPSYNTYLKRLRSEGYCMVTEDNEETYISKQKVH